MKRVAVLVFVFAAADTAFGQSASPAAFRDLPGKPGSARAAHGAEASIRRSRAVAVDLSLFDRAAAKRVLSARRGDTGTVRLNFFADRTLDVTLEGAELSSDRKTLVWTGRVNGHPLGHAVFVVSNGAVTGNVTAGDGLLYQVRSRPEGGHDIVEVDMRAFPDEAEPRRPGQYDTLPPQAGEDQPANDGTTIDVMVVCTPAVRAAAGGEDALRRLIDLGIAETNQGYANSGMPQRVRLAATGEAGYQESGSLDVDLDRLTALDDGFLDEVHRVRDLAGADIVSLWVEKGDACGIGWLLGNPNRPVPHLAFHVVRRDCATGYFSFGHEMGHNMGAMHAHEDSGGEGAFPYSRGYKHTASAPLFRCIMSYNCKGAGCDRVNLWSSPEVRYRGVPVGDPTTDNRSTLIRTAQIVAAYRDAKQSTPSTPSSTGKGYPESPHPYSDQMDRTWTYTQPGNPPAIYVTFDTNTYVEEDYDWIVVTDGQGQEVDGSPFTGDALAGKTLRVPGDTVHVRLLTDESITEYGFAVSNISPANGGGVDLVAKSLSAPLTGVVGQRMEGVVSVVRNDGAAPAPAFRIGYYFVSASKEVTFTGWGCQVPGLAPGATYTCGGGIVAPPSLAAGEYVLAVVADDQETAGDTDFSNNARASDSGMVTLRLP